MKYFTLPKYPKNRYYAKDPFGRNILCFEINEEKKVKIVYWHELTMARDFLEAYKNIQEYMDSIS